MQKVMVFTKLSLLGELAVKINIESASINFPADAKKKIANTPTMLFDLSQNLMSKVFDIGEYKKVSLEDEIKVYLKNHTVSNNGQRLKLSVLESMEKVKELLDDDKYGIKKIKQVFLDNGSVRVIDKTTAGKTQSLIKKIDSYLS